MTLATLMMTEIAIHIVARTRLGAGMLGNASHSEACLAPGWCNPSASARVIDAENPAHYENRPNHEELVPFAGHEQGGFIFRTNGQGLRRDSDVSIPKPASVFRVLALGDSQVEGYVNNHEHYPHLLEQALQASVAGTEVEVLNAAVGGYGALDYLRWYQSRGRALQPDIVIVNVYLGNDVLGFRLPEHHEAINGSTDEPRKNGSGQKSILDTARERADRFMASYSLGYRITRNAAVAGPLTSPLAELGMIDLQSGAVPAPTIARLLPDCPGCFYQYLARPADLSNDELDRTRQDIEIVLTDLNREVRADGARLVVLPIPAKPMIEPHDDPETLERSADVLNRDLNQVRDQDETALRTVIQSASSAGAILVDPLDELRAAAQSERLYYRVDWHLNTAGHRALSSILASALDELQLVP
jgi:lysophospholipase L1-like esterase